MVSFLLLTTEGRCFGREGTTNRTGYLSSLDLGLLGGSLQGLFSSVHVRDRLSGLLEGLIIESSYGSLSVSSEVSGLGSEVAGLLIFREVGSGLLDVTFRNRSII